MVDDEASGSFISFFMTNNSISGFTVRGYMAGAMFQSIMSGVSSIDSILGGFNSLRDQLINGGFGSNPEKKAAVYDDRIGLLEKGSIIIKIV
ncbi:hypothetical protein [Chryseobacterium indologenes]|uniref:Uncharacterized protein n=1 Tax=Chryseobacterium indologenes TaxID=253 RepID=A0A0N1KSK0_CHRID|nr:hypothetical protein [Chryseobacterium indologenes]KPE48977.1 hypothetical protein AOB46_22525 [Chryseobacterium indologenes]